MVKEFDVMLKLRLFIKADVRCNILSSGGGLGVQGVLTYSFRVPVTGGLARHLVMPDFEPPLSKPYIRPWKMFTHLNCVINFASSAKCY